ncbi:hypothetical protein [Paraburkholderia sp. BL10I2N1]|uniref:hypothetical protein n=1 Tax=Paraburkholderia sp. BL10I2N1 TaxID=1938796 RepID=UPI0010DAD2D8|nr:hypothetical protein [Paraburkholderia sp. BL10I2N1]TDN61996.1 hypothetical protein B0G77_5512 [Paraburkholderia sp. BL10I2N1]
MADAVEYQQAPDVPGLVLSAARFSKFSFEQHFHLDYHIGMASNIHHPMATVTLLPD